MHLNSKLIKMRREEVVSQKVVSRVCTCNALRTSRASRLELDSVVASSSFLPALRDSFSYVTRLSFLSLFMLLRINNKLLLFGAAALSVRTKAFAATLRCQCIPQISLRKAAPSKKRTRKLHNRLN